METVFLTQRKYEDLAGFHTEYQAIISAWFSFYVMLWFYGRHCRPNYHFEGFKIFT